jgi:hypothetical protein
VMVDAKLPRFVVPDLTDFKVTLYFFCFIYSLFYAAFKLSSKVSYVLHDLNFLEKRILALLLRI